MEDNELIPHLFRTEFSKITAVLCKRLGIDNMETAEDIAGETFLSALESWPYKGIPKNPTAWLYTVAKNKALNHIKRNKTFTKNIAPHIKPETLETEIDLSDKNISDSQLQMLFAVCHPSIPEEAQIGLALRVLCGFGVSEIANAFLSNSETIGKRLYRAREKLREEKVRIEMPGEKEIEQRLETVLKTIYLLFSEGYYSESSDEVLRRDLCLEAMRLAYLLLGNEQTNRPEVNALLSLMCFHSSRFDARKDSRGEIILYGEQDETLWNRGLITKGAYYLNLAASGNRISKYHLEANIAYWHTIKDDNSEKWENILQLYNQLLIMEYSPIAALNRTYALSKVKGRREAIAEAEKLKLNGNQYYFTLLGELYMGIDNNRAIQHLQKALKLAKTVPDKQIIQNRLNALAGAGK